MARNGMRSYSLENYHIGPERPKPAANNKTWIRDIIRDSPSVSSEYILISFINCFQSMIDGSDYDVLRNRLVGEGKVYVEDVKLIMKYLSSIKAPAPENKEAFRIYIKTRLTCHSFYENKKSLFSQCITTNGHMVGKNFTH